MKTVIAVFAFLSLSVLVPLGHGQEKSSSEKPRTITPVRLQVVLSEYDGEKKVSSLPYSFLVKSEHGGPEGAYSYFTRVEFVSRFLVPARTGRRHLSMSGRTSTAG